MLDKFFKTIEKITPSKYRWILNHDGFKRYFANTGWMFFGKIFALGTAFFINIFIARYLGPADYGLLSYTISFVGLFGFLSSLGIDNILTKSFVNYKDRKDEIIGTGFYIKIFGSLLAIVSVFFVSFFTAKDLFTTLITLLFSVSFIFQAFNVIEIYFQSQVLSKKIFKAQIISSIISSLLKILCVLYFDGIFWLISIYVIEYILYAILLIFSFKKSQSSLKRWKFNKKVAKAILKNSWPLMLSTVAVGLYMKIDQVMVKNILGNEQSGVYALAAKLSEIWCVIPSVICTSIFPAIINSKIISEKIYKKRIVNAFLFLVFLSVFISFMVMIFSDFIVKTLAGDAYINASRILKIYIWSIVMIFGGTVIGQCLVLEEYTKIFFYSNFFGAVLNIILNIFLIPRFGLAGAAVSTLISYFFATLTIFFYKNPRRFFLKAIISYFS